MGHAILVSSEGSGRDIPRQCLGEGDSAPSRSSQAGANTGNRAWRVDPVRGPSKFAENPMVAVKDLLRQERSKLRHRTLGKETRRRLPYPFRRHDSVSARRHDCRPIAIARWVKGAKNCYPKAKVAPVR